MEFTDERKISVIQKFGLKSSETFRNCFARSSCEIKPYDNGRTLPCFGSTSIMAGKYFTPRRCACPLVSPGIRQQWINHAIHGNGDNTQTIRIPEAINDLRQLPVDGVLPPVKKHNAVLFSQFRNGLSLLHPGLPPAGYGPCRCNGCTAGYSPVRDAPAWLFWRSW